MQYMLLIYDVEDSGPNPGTVEFDEMMQAYGAFDQEVNRAGVFVAGEALLPTSTSTSVRVRGGKAMTTDGPFAETKEALGGYYILDCKDLDEVLAYAAKIPGASSGTVEVRPVMVFD